MKDISGMTREQLLEHIIYLQEKLSRLNEDKLDKIQNDINWIVQYLLKQDKPVQPPPFVQTYYNPLYPQVISQEPQCPNCVTPWKCNGPHILEGDNEMDKCKFEWRGLDDEQKASIAVELLTELIEEVDQYIKVWNEYPEFWNKKDYKAAKRTRDNLIADYCLPSGD